MRYGSKGRMVSPTARSKPNSLKDDTPAIPSSPLRVRARRIVLVMYWLCMSEDQV